MSKDIIDTIKKLTGFDSAVSPKSSKVIIIHVSKGEDRAGILQTLATKLNAKYLSANQLKSTAKCSKGGVEFKDVIIIAKEVVNGKSVASLDARTFTIGSASVTKDYQGVPVKCHFWDSAAKIEKSIIDGCKKETMLGEGVAETFVDFFKTKIFNWGKVEPEHVILKLGVYVGELLSGWVALSGNTNHIKGAHPFKGKVVGFYIPDDPAFKGVDSFVEMKDGSFIAISSKFGKGALASYFGNVLPTAMKKKLNSSSKTLNQLVEICKKRGIDPSKGKTKEIVYEWGFNYFLGQRISQPETIFNDIKAEKLTSKATDAIALVKEEMKKRGDTRRLTAMPWSLSNFFNSNLAKALSSDSTDDTINIISAKEYYQFNLDKTAFLKGDLIFSVTKSGSTQVNIIGGKSGMSDITCKQGWVNYEIVKK